MNTFIVIAGPQSSGKTTAFEYIKKNLSNNYFFLPEINPCTMVNKNHMGCAFVDKNLQMKIADADIQRTNEINIKTNNTYIIETGIFGLVYFEDLLGIKKTEKYYKKYLALYKRFNPIIIFIDTKPEICFKRRKKAYLNRINNTNITDVEKKINILNKYRDTITRLYPLWIKYYNKLPFEKIKIKNNYKTLSQLTNELSSKTESLI